MGEANSISIRMVEQSEMDIAWFIYMTHFYECLNSIPDPHLSMNLSRVEFAEKYTNGNSKLCFATYNSENIGVLDIIDEGENGITLNQIWVLPEYWYTAFVPRIIFEFERNYPDVGKWNIGTCIMLEADIKACQEKGWKAESIKSLGVDYITTKLEKKLVKE